MNRTIEFDLKCLGCGYNLRSLEPAAACPECGRKVAWSLAFIAAIGCASLATILLVARFPLGPFTCLITLTGFGTIGLVAVPLLLLLWPGCVADMNHKSR